MNVVFFHYANPTKDRRTVPMEAVPRKGDRILIGDALFRVMTVTWHLNVTGAFAEVGILEG